MWAAAGAGLRAAAAGLGGEALGLVRKEKGPGGFEGSVPGTTCPESPRDGRGAAAGCGALRYPARCGSARLPEAVRGLPKIRAVAFRE